VAIFFCCPCGQNLRVDEDLAGGSTRCLACGRLVPVPSLHSANQGIGIDSPPTVAAPRPIQVVPPVPVLELKVTEIPMPPPAPLPYRRPGLPQTDDDEPYRLSEQTEGAGARDIQEKLNRKQLRRVLAEAQRDVAEQRRRARTWRLETHWYEFLVYPLRALPLVLCLALAWATLIAFLVAIWPASWEPVEVVPRLPLALFVFLLLGYTWAFLEATFAAGAAGEAGYVARPNTDRLARAARGGARVVVCFLAGPILPAVVAFSFWLDSGDFQLPDWLIVWELGILAVGYWFLALLAVQERGRYSDASPVAIVKLVLCLGYRVLLAALLVAVIVVGHGMLMFGALEEMHRSLGGWFSMGWCWAGQLFWLLLVLRWLGVSRFHAGRNKKA